MLAELIVHERGSAQKGFREPTLNHTKDACMI